MTMLRHEDIVAGTKVINIKNNLPYEIIGTAIHSETLDSLVIYRKLYGDYEIIVRPYDLFLVKFRLAD